jgi:chitodextrinase
VQVRARDAAGNIGSASSASFTTLDTAAPGAPGTPTFSSITGTSAVVSWTAASDNVGVTAYDYSLNGGAWTAGSSGLTLSGLTNATSYSVQVRARDAAGNIGSASNASFTTLDTSAPTVPGTPTFSSIGATSVVVSFTGSSDNVGVAGYEYSIGGAWFGASSGMTVSGLASYTSYTVQVRAFDAAGNRGGASSNSFTTLDGTPPTPPGTPSVGSIASTLAVASWSAASDNVGVTRYEYTVNGGASWTNVGNTTSATLTGLSPATSYSVQIRARDAAGNTGAVSGATSFTTIAQITLVSRNVTTTIPGWNGGAVQYYLTSGGDVLASSASSSVPVDVDDWLAPKSGMSGFQVFATLVSLSGTSNACGSFNTWIGLTASSSIGFGVGRGGPSGTANCTFDLQIRHTSNPSAILGTARIVLTFRN